MMPLISLQECRSVMPPVEVVLNRHEFVGSPTEVDRAWKSLFGPWIRYRAGSYHKKLRILYVDYFPSSNIAAVSFRDFAGTYAGVVVGHS